MFDPQLPSSLLTSQISSGDGLSEGTHARWLAGLFGLGVIAVAGRNLWVGWPAASAFALAAAIGTVGLLFLVPACWLGRPF